MLRLLPLAVLALLSGCASLDLEGRVTRAAGDAVGRAVLREVASRATAGADGGLAVAAAEFGTHSRLPERLVPAARLDTADVVAWAERELGVSLRRTGTSPAGPDGGVLLRFEQLHDGVPVIGGFYVAEALPGADTVATLAGTVYDDLDNLPRPRIDAAAAIRTAGGGDATPVILARSHPFVAEHALAWRVRTDRGIDSKDVFVDAMSGRVLGAVPRVETAERGMRARADTTPVVLTLPTVYQGERTAMGSDFHLAGDAQRYRLRDDQWGTRVGALFGETVRAVASPRADRWPDIDARNGAYDAFWGLQESHAHLARAHGWIGLRGRGKHPYQAFIGSLDFTNEAFESAAFWSDKNVFIFGWQSDTTPVAELTVVGHELSHAVDFHSANLTYFGESGAVDEAIADIRGIAAHRAVLGTVNDWRVGTEVGVDRSLEDPKSGPKPRPDTHGGEFWQDPVACAALPEDEQEDACGVHVNSGVGAHWFYLLVEGGDGENDDGDVYDLDGVGFDLAERIVHRAHTRYLGPTSDYADFRRATTRAAADLTGERAGTCDTPTLDAVERAWHAVGVGPPPCQCLEGSFMLSFSGPEGRIDRRMFARGDAVALEIETDAGTIYSRSRAGGATITMRGAVDFRGVPTDALYDAAGLPRREYRVELPRQREPEFDLLEDAWNAGRTGRSRAVGPYTAYEYDWARVARGIRAAGVPVDGPAPTGTVWTVRDMCLSLIDVTAGPTQITYGAYERRQSWLGFLGLPVEFGSPEGTMRITDLREHAVSDDIIGQ